ncbi:MAG: M1 family aminopeptidase [Acidobacteriota bacterium]
MLKDLLRFELRFHTRQPSFAAACLFFFGVGFALTGTGFGAGELNVNAPSVIAQSLGFASLFSIFALAIFGSHALLRDADSRMHEIVFTTPVGRFHYLFSRFAGAYFTSLLVLALTVLGMVAALLMPWQDPARVAAFDPLAYLYAFAVVIVPNLLFANAVLFAAAARTRSALATYVAAVFIYVLYFVVSALTNSPLMAASVSGKGLSSLPALLDPFGLSGFFYDTRYWSAFEKNTRFVPLAGTFLVNRLLAIGAAGAIWALLHRTFTFRLIRRSKGGARPDLATAAAPSSIHHGDLRTITVAEPSSAAGRWLGAWLSASRSEIRALLRNGSTAVLLVLWAGLAVTEIHSDVLEVEYGAALWPATSLIVRTLSVPLSIIGIIVVLYFTAEAFWRERQTRLASIVEATPVRASVMIAAKWTGMATLIATFAVVGVAAGVALQLSRGYTDVQPLQYASLFYLCAWPLILYAAAAILIHALSPGKYIGMMLTLLFVAFMQRAQLLGLQHHLWRFPTAPPVKHSDLAGFGDASAFHAYMLLWSAVAMLFLVFASMRWRAVRRGERMWPMAALLGGVALATGGWIFYNTTVLNPFETADDLARWKAAYERKYRPLADAPEPEIVAIETNVDLDPEHHAFALAGRYDLVNRSAVPLETIHVTVRRQAQQVTLAIADARLIARDPVFGLYTFRLDRPLLPAQRTTLRYALRYAQRGFTDDEPDRAVAANGTFLRNIVFPSFGYREGYELTDERERKKFGLPPLARDPEAEEHGPSAEVARVAFTATLSTPAGQTAVTSGTLEKSWRKGDRNFFLYRATAPIPNQFGITSARTENVIRRAGNVDLVLHQHPGHGVNANRILTVAAQSLGYLTANIGPYPQKQLHLAEVPGYWPFGGFAYPGMILLNEDRVFRIDDRDPQRPDLLLRRVAHEVAHQWFGHQLVSRDVDGGSALVESLTKYAELMILERMRGREQVGQILGVELDRYLAGRGSGTLAESPLYRVTANEPYLYYGKGALVMYSVRALIGEEAVNRALRGLMTERNATTLDLLEHLRRVASADDDALIEEWFREVVLYDLKLVDAGIEKRPDGRYDVRLRVSAAKTHTDAAGKEHPVPMNERIEIAADEHVQSHVLHSGMNELTLTVDQPPTTIAVDPRVLRIDKNRFDNEKRM